MHSLCYTRSEERVREQERTLELVVKALFVIQLPAGQWAAGVHGHAGIRLVPAGVHRSWVCLELPVGREWQVGTAEIIFLTWHWEMEGRGKGEINYVCFDVSHQRKLKLLFGNGCVQEEAWISPPPPHLVLGANGWVMAGHVLNS